MSSRERNSTPPPSRSDDDEERLRRARRSTRPAMPAAPGASATPRAPTGARARPAASAPPAERMVRALGYPELTGRLQIEVAHALHSGTNVALLALDVDHFRAVNERYGSLAGDRALGVIASCIARTLPPEDLLGRHESDRFVVLAPELGPARALRVAERIREAVDGLRFQARGGEVRVTVSIGVASLSELEGLSPDPAALVALAFERLARAKAEGRNRVCGAGDAQR